VKRFTDLYRAIDQTTKTNEKVGAMEAYFREAAPADAAWALFFLCGWRLKGALASKVFRDAAMEASGVAGWMLDECQEATGDLSEAVALLLPDAPATAGGDLTLEAIVRERIVPLQAAAPDKARRMLIDTWAALTLDQRLVFNKLVRGNFRVGVQRALVVRALAQAAGAEPALVAHRLSGDFEPSERGFLAVIGRGPDGATAGDDAAVASRPYPFCLASQFQDDVVVLGDISDWQLEFKWDGIRAQILRREGIESGIAIWSRGEEPIARQFPEIARNALVLPPGTVIDGEILAWRFDGSGGFQQGRALSFNALQQRINRKKVDASLFDIEGVTFAAFDLLEFEAQDLRARPLRERRALLEQLLIPLERQTGGVLRLPRTIGAQSWEELVQIRSAARKSHNAEGVMMKHAGSRYHGSRVAGGTAATARADGGASAGWWKWKIDPFTVDAVLIAAQQGSGNRAGLFTDYTFGVWDPDCSGRLTPFAKAYSGLTREEIAKVDAFIRSHITGRAGPVRMVEPELVFEIGFEGIQESTRHKSGIAVRFPRILRWRQDKTAKDADTIRMVRGLLEDTKRRDCI
jgi:DNA ligase-1